MDSGLKNKLPTRNVLNGINLSLLTRRRGDGATEKWSQETANVAIVKWKAFMHLPSHSPFKEKTVYHWTRIRHYRANL